ncbi:MAG: acetyl-CoA carboxylase biotin carboxylase subunit [Aquisalimonadaceae bacterium]
MLKNIKSVLIANRGEIALRIVRACQELGVRSVVAHSEADADSLPVRAADQAICIGPAHAGLSYQNQQALVGAALSFGVDAIHPGYGFLAENPGFAEKCEQEGVTFIGPSSDVIRRMGDKIKARKIAMEANVPTIPGSDGAVSDEATARKIAKSVGFPLLIKASAGGGGRGMRVVPNAEALAGAVSEIMSEAEVAFGDPSVYIEKYLTDIRHVEVQVLSDGKSTVHLGERDCSAQRRNQKLVEEAPSPALNEAMRKELCESALRLCKAVGYRSAGTVEYVFDNTEGKFYFIEMNTRVQVEHPVSELITGIDIIKSQLRIADGQPLGLKQRDVRLNGHAIECRLNAEDPDNGFAPCPGVVTSYRPAGGFGVRMDSHLETGYTIPPFYDSMVGKLICWGRDREEAIERMLRALKETEIEGVKTTADFHRRLIDHPAFRSGKINTGFVAEMLKGNV